MFSIIAVQDSELNFIEHYDSAQEAWDVFGQTIKDYADQMRRMTDNGYPWPVTHVRMVYGYGSYDNETEYANVTMAMIANVGHDTYTVQVPSGGSIVIREGQFRRLEFCKHCHSPLMWNIDAEDICTECTDKGLE